MVVRMKKLYDLVSKPTAVRKLSCSDCMTARKAFRKSLGVILFISSLKPMVPQYHSLCSGIRQALSQNAQRRKLRAVFTFYLTVILENGIRSSSEYDHG